MIERREFLQSLGGGLLVVLAADAQRTPTVVSGWLHIAGDGAITAFAGKAEMGQNVRTSLAQAVAEELRAPAAAVRMVVGDTDLTPYDAGTFGSRTTPYTAPELRKAAAEARHMLAELAARKWNVEPADITFENARASTKDGRSCGYGELTRGQKMERTIRPDIALRPATEWTVLGTSAEKVGGREIVTGRHKYPSDIRRPGMLYGKVLRPPAFGAELVSASGPQLIRDGDFAGVVAPTPEAAEEALAAVRGGIRTAAGNGASAQRLHPHLPAQSFEDQRNPLPRCVAVSPPTLRPLRAAAAALGEFLRVHHHERSDSLLFGGRQGVDSRAHGAPAAPVPAGVARRFRVLAGAGNARGLAGRSSCSARRLRFSARNLQPRGDGSTRLTVAWAREFGPFGNGTQHAAVQSIGDLFATKR